MSVLEVTRRLHFYNRRANEQVLRTMDGLSAADLATEARVSFGTVRGALWHMIGAQMGWLRIVGGGDTWSRVTVRDSASHEGLAEVLRASDNMWAEFLDSLTEDDALRRIELPIDDNFRTSVGPELLVWADEHGRRPLRPLWQSALHVVNHSTQHRAEIGMHLAALGRSPDDMDYGTFEENRAVRENDPDA